MYLYKPSRSTCVSARDVPVIMERSPFQTRNELLLEKCHWRKKKQFTESMKRGVDLEPEAMYHLCKHFDIPEDAIQYPGFTRHPKYEYIGGVPDGIYDGVLIEIKCPGRFTSQDKPADFYIAQMQVYMQIFDLKTGLYVEYIQNSGLKIMKVCRDDLWWDWVLPIVKCFWGEVEFWRINDITKNQKLNLDVLESAETQNIISAR